MGRTNTTYDVIVVGGGVAGLAAAVFAALGGAEVALFERSAHLGGAVAVSDGLIWAPNSQMDQDADLGAAERYLDEATGAGADKSLYFSFLQTVPRAIDSLVDEALVDLRLEPGRPDFLPHVPGAAASGRTLMSIPFDGRYLDTALDLIRPPLPEMTVLGGMMAEVSDLSGVRPKSLADARRKARLLSQYLADRMRYGRATRLVTGQALIAYLVQAALDTEISLYLNTPVTSVSHRPLRVEAGVNFTARQAIIFATGGFANDPEQRARNIPADLLSHFDPVDLSPQQGLHARILALGARYHRPGQTPVLLAPHSQRRRADGSVSVYAHVQSEGSKPGVMLVDDMGNRFVNEALGPQALAKAQIKSGAVPAYLIADAAAVRHYGLGLVRAGSTSVTPFLNDGYLTSAPTLDSLAYALGMDAGGLVATARRMADFAERGEDPDFGRGRTALEHAAGDPQQQPNPALGPLTTPPFYALRLRPGVMGSAMGFATNHTGQMLDRSGAPMTGLYAVGEDMQSPFGDVNIAPGQSLGAAIAFAFAAARHAAARRVAAGAA